MVYNALLSEFTIVVNRKLMPAWDTVGVEDLLSGRKDLSVIAACLEEYVRRMIGVCACRVAIPFPLSFFYPSMRLNPKRFKSLLTPSCKNRIQFVDRRKTIWTDLQTYLHPVSDDISSEDSESVVPLNPLRILLNELAWDLYLLILASRHHCEVALSPTKTITGIDTLARSPLLSRESQSRLSVIRGIFALYSDSQGVPGLRCIAKAPQTSLRERLDEILEDAYLLEASHLRRFLCLKANIKAIKRDLRKLIKFIVEHRPWAKGVLTAATQTAQLPAVPSEAAGVFFEAISSACLASSAPLLIDPIAFHRYTAGMYMSSQDAPFRFIGNFTGTAELCFDDEETLDQFLNIVRARIKFIRKP